MIRQTIHTELLKRLKEKRRFVQVLAGPRQVGKTTVVRQVMEAAKIPAHYASADEPTLRDRTWLEQQWDMARLKAKEGKTGALLVLDEIQKVTGWSGPGEIAVGCGHAFRRSPESGFARFIAAPDSERPDRKSGGTF